MFSNLTLIAVLVFALWIVTIGVYLYVSRQQGDIQSDIDALRKELGAAEKERDDG